MTQAEFQFDRQTQEQMILRHLESGQSITPLDALNLYKCFRLGARVWQLKKNGHKIERRMVAVSSGKRVAEYRLIQETEAA